MVGIAALSAVLVTLAGPTGAAYALPDQPDTSGTITTEMRVGEPLGVAGTDNYDVNVYPDNTCSAEVQPTIRQHLPGSPAVVLVPGFEGRYLRIIDFTNGAHTDLTGCVGPILPATSVLGLYPTITGQTQVGHLLSAHGNSVVPADASLAYQWVSSGSGADVDIAGATNSTYRPTSADVGRSIKVRITASKAGLDPETETSAATQPVEFPTLEDPSGVFAGEARVGNTLHLTDSYAGAELNVIWSTYSDIDCTSNRVDFGDGDQATLSTGTAGRYVAVILSDYGEVSACVGPIAPLLPAKRLDMHESTTWAMIGKDFTVTIKSLAPAEVYTVRIGGIVVASGHANNSGAVNTSARVPESLPAGKTHIDVIGSQPLRSDSDAFTVTHPGNPLVLLDHLTVTHGKTQTVRVYSLHPNEGVTVLYDGETALHGTADNFGTYSGSFPVGTVKGTHTVKVIGDWNGRSVSKTFKVT